MRGLGREGEREREGERRGRREKEGKKKTERAGEGEGVYLTSTFTSFYQNFLIFFRQMSVYST